MCILKTWFFYESCCLPKKFPKTVLIYLTMYVLLKFCLSVAKSGVNALVNLFGKVQVNNKIAYFVLCKCMILGTGFPTFAFCICWFSNKVKVWYSWYFTFNFGEHHASQTFSFFELTFSQCQISLIPEILKCLVFFVFFFKD